MAIQEMRARVKSRVWQAVAKSGVDLSAIPEAQMEQLVLAVADGVLIEIDDMLGEASGLPRSNVQPQAGADEAEEQLLWEGRPFLSISVRYQITTERVRVVKGMVGKDREDIELVRIQDIDQTQSLGERLINVGDIHIQSHDPSSPQVVLNNVADPQQVHEILRRAVLSARKKYGVSYREEM